MKRQKSEVKSILVLASILLFCFNFQICDFFYYNDEVKNIKKWWHLKSDIYGLIIVLLLLSVGIGAKKWLRFVCEIGLGLAVSNLIDKWFYNVLQFTNNDIIMIFLTLAIATYNLVNGNKQRTTK